MSHGLSKILIFYLRLGMQRFHQFSREKHVYINQDVDELLKDIVIFFNGTPVQPLPPSSPFDGAGVYALYYTGNLDIYEKIALQNRIEYAMPIYVGKAVPRGWRQSRSVTASGRRELYSRISQHARNISLTDLGLDNFAVRFAIFEGACVGMIAAIEAKMIEIYTPIWNSCIDGFGNHDPGKGRYKQALSEWDCLHPGREWVKKLDGPQQSKKYVLMKLKKFMDSI